MTRTGYKYNIVLQRNLLYKHPLYKHFHHISTPGTPHAPPLGEPLYDLNFHKHARPPSYKHATPGVLELVFYIVGDRVIERYTPPSRCRARRTESGDPGRAAGEAGPQAVVVGPMDIAELLAEQVRKSVGADKGAVTSCLADEDSFGAIRRYACNTDLLNTYDSRANRQLTNGSPG